MIYHTETKDGITYTLSAEQDEIGVTGNAMASGDGKFDKKVENKIIARLEKGDIWAWAAVTVTAEIEGIEGVTGTDHLGACSYASYKQFIRPGDYYSDMKAEAKANLLEKLNNLVQAAKEIQ